MTGEQAIVPRTGSADPAVLGGQVAFVTGGGRNIGRAIALTLADRGADVAIIVDTHVAEAEAVAREIASCGRRSMPVAADVSRFDDVTVAVERVLDAFGRIDILVNAAAARAHSSFADLTVDEWERSLAVNMSGPFFCCKAVVPSMLANRSGRIINIAGSGVHLKAHRGLAVTASEAGLVGLTQSVAFELGPFGITANVVSPHVTNTDRTTPFPEGWAEKELGEIPLGRFAEPADIADTCAFLASPAAAYITGQTIHVNGGRYML